MGKVSKVSKVRNGREIQGSVTEDGHLCNEIQPHLREEPLAQIYL